MQKNIVQLEVEINARKFRFDCDPNSPAPDVYAALNQMLTYVGGKLYAHKPKEEEKPKEEKCEEKDGSCSV